MQKITFLFNVPSQYLKTERTNVFINVTCKIFNSGSGVDAYIDSIVTDGVDAFDLTRGSAECIGAIKTIALQKYQDLQKPNSVQITEKAAA